MASDVACSQFWTKKRFDLCAGIEGAGHPSDIVVEGSSMGRRGLRLGVGHDEGSARWKGKARDVRNGKVGGFKLCVSDCRLEIYRLASRCRSLALSPLLHIITNE